VSDAWHIVDIESRSDRYIDVDYKSLREAVAARDDLLKFFEKDNPWRKRLVIRCPDRSLFNPDKKR
jgi:hypothetical protein